jgi:hypothetical protein
MHQQVENPLRRKRLMNRRYQVTPAKNTANGIHEVGGGSIPLSSADKIGYLSRLGQRQCAKLSEFSSALFTRFCCQRAIWRNRCSPPCSEGLRRCRQ